HVTARSKALDRARDPAVLVQRALARPDIEADAETGEACLDLLAHDPGRPMAEVAVRVDAGRRRRLPGLRRHRRSEVLDVLAVVAVIGHRLAPMDRGDRGAQIRDLAAHVVEVVL